MSLIDLVKQQLGHGGLREISEHLGIDPATSHDAVTAAVPLMLGSMAQQADQPGGAAAIYQEASSHPGLLGDLGEFIRSEFEAAAGHADNLVSRLLGQRNETVQHGVQQASGLDPERTTRLLVMLAPIVMGALAHHLREQHMQPTQLASVLQQEAQIARLQAQAQLPRMGGLLGSWFGRR
jgi:hypothetical protein